MTISLPEEVNTIINTLEKAGFEAYAVGGCVRDILLGVSPKDYDITTDAKPEEVKELFRYTVDTGIKHGTVTVLVKGQPYEVTTYRVDGKYEDGRHPSEVTFTPSLTEDLKRRDFTVNAMAYGPEKGIVDIFGGREDLKNRIIRCVGDPEERFEEDALRIMRAVRFSAQLGFDIEEKTSRAAAAGAGKLRRISAERIRDELVKVLMSPEPARIKDMYDLGITAVIMPEFDRCMETEQNSRFHIFSVGEHIIKCLENTPPDPVLRLAVFMHDIGKPAVHRRDDKGDHFRGHQRAGAEIARSIMRRLRFDNETIRKVTTLVYYHDYRPDTNEAAVRVAVNKIGNELFPLYLEVQKADGTGKNPLNLNRELERIGKVSSIYDLIIERGDCTELKDLKINGNDLLKEGIGPGVKIGRILDDLLREVLRDQSVNEKEILLKRAEEINKKMN